MAKKKRVKEKKRFSRNVVKSNTNNRSKKIRLAFGNLILFVILFIASILLYNLSNAQMYKTLFGILSILFGFVSLALVMVLLILWLVKLFNK